MKDNGNLTQLPASDSVSSSPDRYAFGTKLYVKRLQENPDDANAIDMLAYYTDFAARQAELEATPEWQQDNLEHDLRSTDWILTKVRQSEVYAQHLYAALCNCDFMRLDVVPILMEKKWSCSWRHAGGIIAHMRQEGDYIDWYCSGIGNTDRGYVGEGTLTEEIEQDLITLGWKPLPDDCDVV